MIWAILILILGAALFAFGGKIAPNKIAKKAVKVLAIVMIAGSAARLYIPHYLVNQNPLILQDMIQSMQDKKTNEASKEIKKFVKKNMDSMIVNAPVMGNEEAKNTIFLWTDYSCPYCRRVHAELARVVSERDDVRVVLKNFSIHGALSDAPAQAVIAAKLQGNDKAAALDNLLSTRDYFSRDDMQDQANIGKKVHANVMKFAAEVGLDIKKLESDMTGEVVLNELGQTRELAQRFEIGGTPFLIINDKAFPGAISYADIIEALK